MKMDNDILKGYWDELNSRSRQQWNDSDDLTQTEGSYEELLGKIQKKYGYQTDRIEKGIDDFLYKNVFDEE